MKINLFLTAILLTTSIYSQAQISLKTEYMSASGYWLDKGDNPNERIGNAKGSAMVYQGSVNIPLSMKMNGNRCPTLWGIGLSGSYVSLNNKNFTDDLVISEIMNMEIGIYHMRPLNDRWSWMASVGAGIYSPTSDLTQIRSRHILGSVGALFIYKASRTFEIGGGIALNNTFGYPMVFPALHLNWMLQGRFDLHISMANGVNIEAGNTLNRFLRLSLIADMNGQSALLKKNGKNVIFTHQYIVTGIRSEIKTGTRLSFPITVGINAVRPAGFTDRTLKAMFTSDNDYYFSISPYISAGINISF